MKNFISSGDIVEIVAPTVVKSGDIVVVGSLVGIACADAASGAPVNIKTTGVFEVAKTSAQAWTVGADVYATSAGVATTVSTSNTYLGKALAVAANPSARGIVRLGGTAA